MSETSFHRVISDHLALCERNRRLEGRMPLDRYRNAVEGGSTPPKDESERWLDPDSSWDTTRERPLPPQIGHVNYDNDRLIQVRSPFPGQLAQFQQVRDTDGPITPTRLPPILPLPTETMVRSLRTSRLAIL